MKNHLKIFLLLFPFSYSFCEAQTPVLNSYPSATATLFLDFDGQMVNGTSWNVNGPISCGPSNLSAAQITEIFNRVSEDYRPFNVNITTDSTKYWSAPSNKRMRLILTVTSDWYGKAGGVSFIGSFTWGDNTPAFVFTALLNYNSKNIAEAAAHEIGHTLGLRHQSSYDANCAYVSEYNSGVGSGEIGWAPIMGVGYYRNFTLWNNGANPYGCTNYQDDLGIITSATNGFGFRADDVSNETDATATSLAFTSNQFAAQGVIEKMSDRDVFRFTIPEPGNFHLDALPYNTGNGDLGSDLDMEVSLLTNSQNVLGSYNPDLILSSAIDTILPAGNYYLVVQGKGNMFAPEYASLGSYTLKATYSPSTVLALRQLKLQGSAQNNQHQFSWNIDADEQVVKQQLETSNNGIDFHLLSDFNKDQRNFSYTPLQEGILYYRVHVLLDNGQRFYSNIIALRSQAKNIRPILQGNLIQHALLVSSPASFDYEITDYSGREISKGKLVQGVSHIDTEELGRGMYLIRFSNGKEVYTEKFLKL
ncbi:MAG: zinc-dependent metalloprotease [Flavisolibacter sp.]